MLYSFGMKTQQSGAPVIVARVVNDLVTKTSYPAQIVFTEVDNVLGPRRWTGRLLRRSACVDGERHNREVTWTPRFDIIEDPKTGRCTVTLNGGNTSSSLRYAHYRDVTEAQKAGIRWAGRRFRIPTEVAA